MRAIPEHFCDGVPHEETLYQIQVSSSFTFILISKNAQISDYYQSGNKNKNGNSKHGLK